MKCSQSSPYTKGRDCNSYNSYFISLLGFIGFVFFSIPNIFFTYFQQDLNPFSKKPIACPKSNLKLYRLLIKLFLPFYIVSDYKGEYSKFFELSMTIIYFVLLCLRFQSPSFYNLDIDKWMVSSDLMLLWTALCSTIHAVNFLIKIVFRFWES